MTIFSTINRTFQGPAAYAEPMFSYLDRSARNSSKNVRDIIETWFEPYPSDHQAEIQDRLQTSNDIEFLSAFYELLLYQVLKHLGYKVEIHPKVPTGNKQPDFLSSKNGESGFFLEAVLAFEFSDKEQKAAKRMQVFYDTINALDSPNFFIGMKIEGYPQTPPSGKTVRKALENFIKKLDPTLISHQRSLGEFESLPKLKFSHEGLNVIFYPIPKSPKIRGKNDIRPIGMQHRGFRKSNTVDAIRSAIKKKAGRYGRLGLPYIVGINVMSLGCDREDVIDALFGTSYYLVDPDGPIDQIPERHRKLDCVWFGYRGKQNTRVSGALITKNLNPWSFAKRDMRLYKNPWANHSIEGEITSLGVAKAESGKMEFTSRKTLGNIFELADNWPEINVAA